MLRRLRARCYCHRPCGCGAPPGVPVATGCIELLLLLLLLRPLLLAVVSRGKRHCRRILALRRESLLVVATVRGVQTDDERLRLVLLVALLLVLLPLRLVLVGLLVLLLRRVLTRGCGGCGRRRGRVLPVVAVVARVLRWCPSCGILPPRVLSRLIFVRRRR